MRRYKTYTLLMMSLALAAAFALSMVPLMIFIARRDRSIALIAPVMIAARAVGLSFGLLAGSLGETVQGVQWLLRKPGKITGRGAR